MNLPAAFFPSWLLVLSALISAGLLLRAIQRENWLAVPQSEITSWLAASVIIMLLWLLKAQIHAGLAFQLLGSSALTLIAGPRRAAASLAVMLAIHLGFGHGDLITWGLSFLLVGILPIAVTHNLLRWAQSQLAPNYFVYIFLNCFFAAALSMWLYALNLNLLLASVGAYPSEFLFNDVLPYYFLMGWPEAFSTGLNLTLLVVWRPEWVSSFNDRVYLQKK